MIASAGVLILTNAVWAGEAVALADTNWAMAAIFAVCLVLLRKTKLSPILVMLWPEPSICCCRHSRTDAPADVRHSSYMGFSPFSAADGAGADIR